MSKVNSEILSKALDTLLDFSAGKEVEVTLKQIDPAKDKRFSGSFQLPNPTRSHMDVCIFVNDKHEQICKKEGIPCMNVDEITNLNKNKKLIRKLAKKYDAFLAS
ncbi:60S ribosomal protein L10, partial [Blastocystis sp. subtype 4]|uniref:60S ribosomal protein L10 n=1 Tax=Blastocystis sp. subtype 4 TaxID=944170 RepID=UPI00071155F4